MEVCVDGQWGTFCAYSTSQDVGDAICGTVGFASQGNKHIAFLWEVNYLYMYFLLIQDYIVLLDPYM